MVQILNGFGLPFMNWTKVASFLDGYEKMVAILSKPFEIQTSLVQWNVNWGNI